MSNILKKEREVVIPGECLAEGMDYLPGDNTYREGEKIFSKVLGLVGVAGRVMKITPLSGPYLPRTGDKIIAKVFDITMSGWRFQTNTAYSAMMNVKDASSRFIKRDEDLSQILSIGDYAVVKITKVTSQNLIDLTMKEPGMHKISGGRLVKINSQKVPRIIGKQGSMISLIKEKTGCNITVGQNGIVWIKGEADKELLAEKAVKMIQERSHEAGLTDKMEKFLSGGASQ
ncbi:RNA-binding protein [Candidatus Woesearchaeota archaeon]|jgi:exosome complex component RRP4|nr:RNA-binding protein [Candidatus Woesearchaeota archaeon]MBT4110684.1 RNA-binding protein [Candidatus Woesearchaeota archaeon]MBT4336280.1 RNA-binding protein [Candidatus Woesearchaeota archaeon]MBT4469359.1 RNA-binding protein [Candidatus Woesearchaeota archaeon]MBT6743818.1 RNA-binding protein [Candidatus Woesearchaeota archaeon]